MVELKKTAQELKEIEKQITEILHKTDGIKITELSEKLDCPELVLKEIIKKLEDNKKIYVEPICRVIDLQLWRRE